MPKFEVRHLFQLVRRPVSVIERSRFIEFERISTPRDVLEVQSGGLGDESHRDRKIPLDDPRRPRSIPSKSLGISQQRDLDDSR